MIDYREGREIIKQEKNNAISLNILNDYDEVLDFAEENAARFLVKESDGSTSPCLDLKRIINCEDSVFYWDSDLDFTLDEHFNFDYDYSYFDDVKDLPRQSNIFMWESSKSVLLTKKHIDIPKEVKASEVDNYVAKTYKSELEALHNFVKITMPKEYEEKIESLEKSEHSKILQELQILTYDSTPLKNLREVFGEYKKDDKGTVWSDETDRWIWEEMDEDQKVREIFANYIIHDHINELLADKFADVGTSGETWDYDVWGCYSKGAGVDLLDNECKNLHSSRFILQRFIKSLPRRFDINCDAEVLATELLDTMKSLKTTDDELKIDFTNVFIFDAQDDKELTDAFWREVYEAFNGDNTDEGYRLYGGPCDCEECLLGHPWCSNLTELNLKQKPICPKTGAILISEDEEDWWSSPCCKRSVIVRGEHDHLLQREIEDENGDYVKVPFKFKD